MHSNLQKIIKRLDAMTLDNSSDHQVREFSQYGVPVCKVTYLRERSEFLIERYNPDHDLVFDNIDLVAIEIYDCLYDFQHSF